MENQLTPNNSMILEIRELLENARKNVAQQVNTQLLTTYWNIGRIIVEYEQQNQIRADYGKQTLRELSKELTREFGKGFSRSNLQNMRAFYLAYEKCQTVSGKLSWSHYCELLSITDENKRSFYEKESINSGWSVRELKRQIDSSLYERLLLSSGDANKEKVLSLAQKGIDKKDVNINQSIDFGSTAAAFSGGQGDYTIEFEPSATLLEQKGDGYVVASVGTESGYVPYTSYSVKQSYLKTHGATVEKFTKALQKGMDFVQTHTPEEIAEVIAPQFAETELETITAIVRRYYALVWGNPDADEGTIEGNIGRSPKDKLQMCVFADGEQGKHAVTHWRVVRRYGYVTLVECRLETGRTHQIRVHMAWKGFPLFNDARYGGARILKGTTFSKYRQFVENCFALLPRQALHARCLGFVHPSTGREVYFESELPADFRAVLDRWENYATHVRTDAE